MTCLNVMIPDEVQRKVLAVVEQTHISLDEFTTLALVEKLSTAIRDPYLEERARRGDRKKFDEAMAMVADVPPEDYDRLD